MSRGRLLACLYFLVNAVLAERANAQFSSWHPKNFARGDRGLTENGVGDGGDETTSGEADAVDREQPLGAPWLESERGAGFTPPKTTPAEQKSCGCLAGVNDYDLYPESDFWTTTPLPEPSTLNGALEAASSRSKVALVMMTNAGEVDLVDNFLCSLRMFGVNKYLIFATDSVALAMLRERGYHAWDGEATVGKGLDKSDSNFRTSSWKQLTRAKMKVAKQVLQSGHHMFFSDVDVVALENFLPSLVSESQKSPQWLLDWDGKRTGKKEANTGFYFMRAEKGSIDLLTKATLQQKKMPAKDDQQLINAVMTSGQRNYMPRPKFANGCYLRNVGKSTDLVKKGVAAVHVNCAVNKLMKHKLMCNMGLWFCANVPEGGNPRPTFGGRCKPGYGMERFRGYNSSASLTAVGKVGEGLEERS